MKTGKPRPDMTEPGIFPEPKPPKIKITLAVKFNGKKYMWRATKTGCAGCVFYSPKNEACRQPRGFAECVIAGISGTYKREGINETGH